MTNNNNIANCCENVTGSTMVSAATGTAPSIQLPPSQPAPTPLNGNDDDDDGRLDDLMKPPPSSKSLSSPLAKHHQLNHQNNHHHHNGHLVQMFDDNEPDVTDGGDDDQKSPYEPTTTKTINDNNAGGGINLSFTSSSSSSSSPPPSYHESHNHVRTNHHNYHKNYHNNDPETTSTTSGAKLPTSPQTTTATATPMPPPTPPSSPSSAAASTSLSSTLSSLLDSQLWKILHMITVVVASATINGVVFGVVNNFGVIYAYLTELSKNDITQLGFNHNGQINGINGVPTNNGMDDPLSYLNSTNNNYTASITPTSDALVQSLIAGVGSFNVGLIFFCSIFASVLSDRYGIRAICFIGGVLATIGMYASSVSLNLIYLYVTYGLVLGIGASLVYGPSLAILGHYFTKRLGLVNGLVTAGSSAFSIVMPILLRWLLDLVGIQVTFKYLSILMATLILCSLSFKEKIKRPSKQNGSAKKNLANMFFYDALWKNNLYLYWVISIPMGLFGYFVPFCHLVKHAREINSYYQGEVLVMSIGITSMIGRLITGPLADFSRVNRICMQQIAFASIGVLTMFLPWVRDFPLLLACCGLGLFDGCFISLLGPIAFDLVGPEYANQAIGLLLCFCSIPLTTGPPIAAYAYGIYGNYKLAFCLAGIPPIFAALLMFNIIRMQRMQRRRTSTVKLGIDDRFDEVIIVNNSSNKHQQQQQQLALNGEKLHLLINGGNDHHHHHNNHHHNHMGINGTTKLKLSDDHGNEKTGLLLNGNAADGNHPTVDSVSILPKDHHTPTNQSKRKSSFRI